MTDSELALELERQPSDADGLDLEQLPATLKEQDVDELLRGDPQATATGERRARTRRPPNSPRLWVYRLLNGVVDRVQRGPLGWALFSAAVAVSGLAIWFSTTQRASLIEQGHEVVSHREELAFNVQQLREAWSEEELNRVMDGVSQAESRVFVDYQQLANWLTSQHAYAQRLSLDFRYTLGEATASQVKNMLQVPITIRVGVKGEAAGRGYLQVLEFLKNLVDTHWYLEVTSASLSGQVAGVTEMEAGMQVWVRSPAESDSEETAQ